MRKVVLYTLMSLDGAVDHPGRYFPGTPDVPGAPVFDDVLADCESRMIATQDEVLLGRGMYDEWSGYWPTSGEQPFADFINGVTKHVVTSTPLTGGWTNEHVAPTPLAAFVEDLRRRDGGDIGVHGSIRLAQSMLAAGLVDELALAVGPVLDPSGRRFFDGPGAACRLDLLEAVATPAGSLWLRYRVVRSEG